MDKSKFEISPIEKVIFFGGGDLMLECAKKSIKSNLDVCVFAAKRHLEEDIKQGNRYTTLRKALEKEGIMYFQENEINKSLQLQNEINDGTIGIGMGEIYTFSKDTINLFSGKLFDLMTIRLPQYRGGAHFTWQILRNSKIGAWCIQLINEEMIPGVFDSGQILAEKEYIIPDTARKPSDFFDIAFDEGLKLFTAFLDKIKTGHSFELSNLQENFRSYFPRLNTLEHGYINWSWNSHEIEKFVCAFDNPYPGASTFLQGEKVFLKNCQSEYSEGKFHPFMSGLIYRKDKDFITVACRDGSLIIRRVLNDKQKDIISSLTVGQRFYTPIKKLEEAMLFDADYDAEGLIEK